MADRQMRRIEVPGKGYVEMELTPKDIKGGLKPGVEIFEPDPMFGGQPTSYTGFEGGGFMEIQKIPEQSPTQSGFIVPGNIPSQLRDRNKYEKHLQSKYGDPWADERNLSDTISDIARQNERGLFDYVFGGLYRYEDRGYLDKKAQDYWQDSKLKLRKNIENQQVSDIEVRKEQMGEQMKAFDSYMKTFKPATAKEPTIADYDKAEQMLYGISHDKEGKLIQPSEASKAVVKKAFDKLGIKLHEVTKPGEEGWFWDDPTIKTLGVTPQPQREPKETPAEYLKRIGR